MACCDVDIHWPLWTRVRDADQQLQLDDKESCRAFAWHTRAAEGQQYEVRRPQQTETTSKEPYSGFPGKVSDFISLVGQLQDLHGDVLVLHTEQLETGVGGLARLGVPVYLDGHVVPLWVPVDPHLCRQPCLFHSSGHTDLEVD